MLIEFNVSNYRSISSPQSLSLAASKGNELADTNTCSLNTSPQLSVLRSAALYGANASGKSNVLKALDTMKTIVVDSAKDYQRGDKLPVDPFLFDVETREAPSEFEVTFIEDGVRYQYGFAATKERIKEEWLLAFPKGRAQRWFERHWDEKANEYVWDMGGNFHGEKQLWQKATRGNALFLSTAVQLNSENLEPIYDWFRFKLRVTDVSAWSNSFSTKLCLTDAKKPILEFLKAADLDIEDINIEKDKFDINALPDEIPEEVKKFLSEDMEGKTIYEVKTLHKTLNGELVTLDLKEESDGTQKLFSLAGPWIDTLKNGYIVFIDELHDNLHPRLVKFLVSLFHSNETNPNNAQLVFSTHETSILNQDTFRRDQVWFCEKDDSQSTTLFPLTDFSPKKGRENLEAAYLAGRYGALPYVKELKIEYGN
ncbi:AAA family ATPase [Aliikangiella maris]|uniref:ATP-binding protein n=2 Tax=Aliikangiella maris TaxID=3162458 RepID=A0ABV3MPW5_9GAMM